LLTTRNEKATEIGTTPNAETGKTTATRNEKAIAGTARNAETGATAATRKNEKAAVGGTTRNAETGTTQLMKGKATVAVSTPVDMETGTAPICFKRLIVAQKTCCSLLPQATQS
jgi:hypothetical protein